MKKTVIALLALVASSTALAATPWQKITQPINGSAQSIGAFANGCIVGAQPLPLIGWVIFCHGVAARQAELARSASRAITVFFIDYQRGIDVVTSPFCAR